MMGMSDSVVGGGRRCDLSPSTPVVCVYDKVLYRVYIFKDDCVIVVSGCRLGFLTFLLFLVKLTPPCFLIKHSVLFIQYVVTP